MEKRPPAERGYMKVLKLTLGTGKRDTPTPFYRECKSQDQSRFKGRGKRLYLLMATPAKYIAKWVESGKGEQLELFSRS